MPESVYYETFDASFEGGRDWLLSGCSVLPGNRVIDAFYDSYNLWFINRKQSKTERDVDIEQEAIRKLDHLRLRCCPPVTVGSKRGSVVHKLHA
eukprot:8611440-Alexandrium_andersonii.AAC.1